MKSMAWALFLALSALGLAAPQIAEAQSAGSSASGVYRFIMEDNLTKYVEFSARTDDRGTTTGVMTFNDEAKVSDRDPEETDEGGSGDPVPFYMKAEFDTLTVEKNRALMSGVVLDSSLRGYIGRWVQLVVEDSRDDPKLPDRLVWRFCRREAGGWVPSDAEVPGDRGAWMSWWATDAERKYDVGIPSKNLIPDETRRCEVYPLQSYSFAEIKRWEGNIEVW